MAESKIQGKILRYLEAEGAYAIKTISTNKRGCPDILACYKGHFIAIEVKDKGKLKSTSALQDYHIDQINLKGGTALVADDVQMVKDIIAGLTKD